MNIKLAAGAITPDALTSQLALSRARGVDISSKSTKATRRVISGLSTATAGKFSRPPDLGEEMKPMVRYMRRIYLGWFVLISAAIVLQFYLAGYGVFAFKGLPALDANTGAIFWNFQTPFDAHRTLGGVIHLAVLIGVGLAFAARVPWRLTGANLGQFVLVSMQYGLARAGMQSVAALPVVNGVLIFVVTLYLTWAIARLPSRATALAGAAGSRSPANSP